MEKKGSKHVCVYSKEEKRQIIVVVSFTAEGILLPLQVVLTSKAFRSLSISMKDGDFVKDLESWMGSNNKHQSLVNFTNIQGLYGVIR